MMAKGFLRAAALAALLVPSLALAQPAQSPAQPAPSAAAQPAAPVAAQPAAPSLSPATAAAVEARISSLKSRLGITPEEQPLWDAFAQAMRDNTASTDALFAQRAASAASMSAVDNMHSYAAIARAYADSTQRLSIAFDSLYAGLSDVQKRAADTLFREQATTTERSARH